MQATKGNASKQFFRRRALSVRWNCNPSTIWRMQQRGDLPPPTRISPGIVAWSSDVIEAIERERTAAPVHDDARQPAGA